MILLKNYNEEDWKSYFNCQLVEYLESTGTQWIDTGFKHDQNTRFVAKFEVLNVTYNQSRWIDPFGSWGDVKAASGTNYGKMKG